MKNGAFKNRIVSHGSKPASQFMANPLNWRQHPPEQRSLLNSVLKEIGWVQDVVENVRTGNLIDGHERVWQGLQNGDAEVPYVQVDLSPDEEKTMLALLDPISAMAYTDKDNLKSLLGGITAMDANITKFLSEMAEKEKIIMNDETNGHDESLMLQSKFQILIDCKSEQIQAMLLEKLSSDGYECRAFVM